MKLPRASGPIRVIVSSAIMACILWKLPLGQLGQSLRGVDGGILALGLASLLPTLWLAARKLQILLVAQEMRISLSRLCSINLASEFYGLFLPGTLAQGAVRWHKLQKAEKKRVETASVIVYNRWVETTVMAGLGLCFWPFDPLGASRAWVMMLFAAALFGLLLLYLALFFAPGNRLLSRLLEGPRFPRFRSLRSLLVKGLDSAQKLGRLDLGSTLAVFVYSAATHLLGAVFLALAADALGLTLSFETVVWVRSGLRILAMLPISWLEIGIRDGALIFLLAPYGVSPANAVALSMLMLVQRVLWGVAGGFVEALGLSNVGGDPRELGASSERECSTRKTSPSSSPT